MTDKADYNSLSIEERQHYLRTMDLIGNAFSYNTGAGEALAYAMFDTFSTGLYGDGVNLAIQHSRRFRKVPKLSPNGSTGGLASLVSKSNSE